ncbi:aldose epimerase family protein [Lacticaseibacillus kribbianus]|uniref:aldose epimerase family protein n=1 Tax=Lacticaseibacillus kribbianus TaxID=2926292 RepID=UPI001CD47B9F|nr:aldose epimerase family protein [Lacticaseibacillus kribbianus]
MLKTEPFGEINGRPVTAYTIENHNGVQLTVLDYGAIWHALRVPTATGHDNLVLNTDLAGYSKPDGYFGRIIGRFAGRIGAGQLTLDGKPVALPANEGTTTLHGGPHGWSLLFFDATAADDHVTFTRQVTPALDGFPGTMAVTVTYTLTDDDEVLLDFTGTTDATTVFNPTTHVYWNLSGTADETIEDHTLQIAAPERFELKPDKTLTGATLANAGTPYDFTAPRALGPSLHALQAIPERGFDDVFAVEAHAAKTPAATLSWGRRKLEIYSDRNALVMFTANDFGAAQTLPGHRSRPYIGLVMEAQDSAAGLVNPALTQATLPAGATRHAHIRYALVY